VNKALAIIKDGIVLNCIVWNDEIEFIPDGDYISVYSYVAGPGWLFDGNEFTTPVSTEEQL
jgi:hypothetical protein